MYEAYLESCLDHIKKQDCKVKILPPYLTSTAGRTWQKGDKSFLMAVTDKLNEIVKAYRKSGASHLLIVNADVEIPRHGVDRLLRLDVDVASGVYPRHDSQDIMTAGIIKKELPLSYRVLTRKEVEGKILGESEWIAGGDGCLLIKKRVLMKYSPHYERLSFHCEGGEASDLMFFHDVQRIGFKTRLDGRVICGHIPEWPLFENVF